MTVWCCIQRALRDAGFGTRGSCLFAGVTRRITRLAAEVAAGGMEGAGEATSTFDHSLVSQVGGIDADADGDGHDDDDDGSFWSKQHTCSVTFLGGKVGEDLANAKI